MADDGGGLRHRGNKGKAQGGAKGGNGGQEKKKKKKNPGDHKDGKDGKDGKATEDLRSAEGEIDWDAEFADDDFEKEIETEKIRFAAMKLLQDRNNRLMRTSTKLDLIFLTSVCVICYCIARFIYGIDPIAVIRELMLFTQVGSQRRYQVPPPQRDR